MTIQDIIDRYRPGFVLERAMRADLDALVRAEIARFCRETGLKVPAEPGEDGYYAVFLAPK